MTARIMIPAALGLAFALPAVAAPSTPSPSGTQSGPTTSQQNAQQGAKTISARLRQSLTQAGFTDVHVMPESFLVRAKDKDGNPVMMVVNPDSVTSVTAVGRPNGAPNPSATGSGSGGASASSANNGVTKG
jgi:hypothetical protein